MLSTTGCVFAVQDHEIVVNNKELHIFFLSPDTISYGTALSIKHLEVYLSVAKSITFFNFFSGIFNLDKNSNRKNVGYSLTI